MKKIMVILLGLSLLASSSQALLISCGEGKVEVDAPGIEKYSLTVHGALGENFEGSFPLKRVSADQLRWVMQLADAIFTDLNSLSKDQFVRNQEAQDLLFDNKEDLFQIYQNRTLLEMISDYKVVCFLDIPELKAAIVDYITDKIVDNDFIENHFAKNSLEWPEFRAQIDIVDLDMINYIYEEIQKRHPKAFLHWDLSKNLEGHTDWVTSAMFSPDGSKIVTASWDETAKIWNANTGDLIRTLVGHTGSLNSAMFSPDGSKIVTASWDETAKIWNANTGALIRTLVGHTGLIQSAEFSPDGSKIVTASNDKTAKIWNVKIGALIRILKIWNANIGNLVHTLEGHTDWVSSAMFSPDGSKIVTASNDETITIWNANTGNSVYTLGGHTDKVNSAIFSPDGNRIVTASYDTTAKIWDVNTGELLLILEGHTDRVNSAEFSPDGSKIVTASWDNTAKIWDANTGEFLHNLEGHTDSVNSAMLSPDGSRIVTASWDSTAKIWTHHQLKYATLDIILMSILLSRFKEQNKVLDLSKMNTKYNQPYLLSIFNKLSDNNKSFFTTAYKNTLYVPRLPELDVPSTYNLRSYIKYLPLLGAATIGGYLLYKILNRSKE